MKQPHIQFYTGDWIKDPKLSLCSPATRGVWIDLICSLHELGHGGVITANGQQIARLCRCSVADVDAAINELRTYGVADICEREGRFTVICRRMKRAADLSNKRQQAGNKSAANREQNPDNDNDNDNEDRGLERVREFARGEGIGQGDADWFYWKGKGNGWTNGGKPILDWKATFRSWKRAGYLPSQKQQSSPNGFQRAKQVDPNQQRREEEQERHWAKVQEKKRQLGATP